MNTTEDTQIVNKWLNELNQISRRIETLSSEISEKYDEYEESSDNMERAGLQDKYSNKKLGEILFNAKCEIEEMEDYSVKVVAYLQKFVRYATKGMMKI